MKSATNNPSTESLLRKINALPNNWHRAGSMSAKAMNAIARHCLSLGEIEHSVETGSGKSTLLLSHISRRHLVFARDRGNGSIAQVRNSDLFNVEHTEFIEGATQKTLPAHSFEFLLDFVLLDGPHGWPFPDLEYYYVYPHIRAGGLLLVDDTQIPTIGRMFEIIRADPMFRLREVVGQLAIFERTEAPAVNPLGDDWWLQGYNMKHFQRCQRNAGRSGWAKFLAKLMGR